MKVFVVNRLPGEPFAERITVTLLTDSSIVYPGRPLFVPPFAQEWEMRIAPVLEICRQGKYVAPKFADRYIGRATLGARLLPAGADPVGSALDTAFDGALSIGPWGEPLAKGADITVQVDGLEPLRIPYDLLDIERAVAEISKRFTLRTGDMLVPVVTSLRPTVAIDTRLSCRLNSVEQLRLKIK